MWDARLEAIRDRKLNELVIFAALVRTDMSKRHEFIGIIDKLNMDLDLIEALAEGGPIPQTEPIDSPLYRDRLSKLETLDEYCFDACRKGESDFGPIICKEHMTTSVAVKQKPESPAVVPKAESPAVIEKAESPAVIPEYPKPVQVESSIEPPESEIPETPASMPEKEPEETDGTEDAEMSDQSSGDGEGIYDMVISVDDAVTLKRVREMKDSKIDLFIDRELNGHFSDDACEDVISFLKTDIKLIDLILSINITSKDDIESKIADIVDFVATSEEPKNQKMYINALNEDERTLEGQYNDVLKRLEDVIKARYTTVLDDDQQSVFFS